MRFGYTRQLCKLAISRKQIMMALGLLAVPAAVRVQQAALAEPLPPKPQISHPAVPKASLNDPRTVRLASFFSRLQCPVRSLAGDFVTAADENHLDWRLLPSISVIESGGGRAYKNNNIFGWSNGAVMFPSIRRSIHEVAYKLGRSPLYRRSNTVGKLRTYNSDQDYVQNVVAVMNRISPQPEVALP
jgi:hypothetical protein